MVPSGRPLNVSGTASTPSLLMIVNDWPTAGEPPTVSTSVAPPRVTPPVTASWSPAGALFTSTANVAALVNVTVLVESVPTDAPPGDTVPAAFTAALTVPVPDRTPAAP